ncbi:MAG: hypothetical protein NZ902_00200 [Acidilobaceae archaeon]|nr:hypothetical protein [Acidilobaceae archaeon]MCX8165260.1 hypothetical protein [Acidilobaceae archaeon]MDW7973686.1 hypothetical protein [Sulfolobales archaeon]
MLPALALLLLLAPGSAQVAFEPLQTTVEGELIPGDSVKVVIVNREERESAYLIYVQQGEERRILSRGAVPPRGSVEIVLTLPWARSVIVEVNGERRELQLAPETRLSVVARGGKFMDVKEDTWLKVSVALRTNVAGEKAKIRIVDEREGKLLKEEEIILIDNYVYEFYLKVEENPMIFPLLKELQYSRPLRIEVVGEDTFPDNNADYLYLTVKAPEIWRIPWGFSVALLGIAVLVALLLLARRAFS